MIFTTAIAEGAAGLVRRSRSGDRIENSSARPKIADSMSCGIRDSDGATFLRSRLDAPNAFAGREAIVMVIVDNRYTFQSGKVMNVHDGHLTISNPDGDPIAVFAPGHWERATDGSEDDKEDTSRARAG